MDSFTLRNKETLAIIGHIVVSNNQIHNYQKRYIMELFKKNSLTKDYQYIESIFSGSDDKIELEESIFNFNNEDMRTKAILYKEIVIISKLDGNIDKYENDLLKQLNIPKKNSKKLKNNAIKISQDYILKYQNDDRDKRKALNRLPEEIEVIKALTERIKDVFIKTNLKQKEVNEESNCTETYENIIKVGKEDYKIVKPIYEELLSETDKIYKLLDKELKEMNGKLVAEKKLKENISQINEGIKNDVTSRINETFNELYIKENGLEYLTISFLGRTKAGKSTLHTILTSESEESIGVGKQRTTRYNRVYQLNNLRLIDTPGIGAAEAEGRTDEEIAKSVIGESDIICIVVSDDSVQEYVFDLAETIVKRNKPVIIVLNHKQNIKNNIRYKLFKKNPSKWLSNENTKGVLGHVQRISDYAKQNKFEDMITSYPVFLLPALMAMDEDYKEDKNMLIDSSNIKNFKKGIKDIILSVGTLLRSQTIVDDSRALFMQSKDQLNTSINKLREVYEKFSSSKESTIEKINQSKAKLIKNCRNDLQESYFELESKYALSFAEENYKSENLNKKWEIFLNDIDFNEVLESKIKLNLDKFSKEIKEILDETLEDFKIGIDNYVSLNDMDNMFLNIDFRKVGGILAGIGGVVAVFLSGPPGIVMGVITVGLGMVSSLFKSKAKKRIEATDKLYKSLKKNINENKDKNIEKTISNIDKVCTNQILSIENAFNNIEQNLSHIINSGENCLNIYNKKIEELDLNYAWRIFEYLSNKNIERSKIKDIILGVDRKYGEYINIKVKYDKKVNQYNDNLIREKITITKIDSQEDL